MCNLDIWAPGDRTHAENIAFSTWIYQMEEEKDDDDDTQK